MATIQDKVLLAVGALADPKCKNKGKRLEEIRRLTLAPNIDKLRLARVLLQEVQRDQGSTPVRPAWRRATRRASRLLSKARANKGR